MNIFRNIKGYYTNTWVLSNPTVVRRALRGFMRALVFNKSTLKTIEVFPSMQCNLKCEMCSVEKFKKVQGEPLALEDYESIARQGAREGAIASTILGGEPLLYPHVAELLSIFKKYKYFNYIVSNSMMATKERLRELKSAGLNAICFSLDSVDPEENDRIRGVKGHYAHVMQAIEWAKSLGLIVSMAPVFFPGAVEKGVEVVKFCQKNGLGASGGQAAPVGCWEGKPLLAPEEHDRVRSLMKEYPRLTSDWALSYFLKMRCPAGKEKIAISTYGEVFGCSVNPISYGNVRRESLASILRRMRAFSQIKKNSPVCLAAEDTHYVEHYLRPLSEFDHYPVTIEEHPAIRPDEEPEVFRGRK